jgi:hypothetical protein
MKSVRKLLKDNYAISGSVSISKDGVVSVSPDTNGCGRCRLHYSKKAFFLVTTYHNYHLEWYPGLGQLPHKVLSVLPEIQFDDIADLFHCAEAGLTSLRGCPKTTGSLMCNDNFLTNLVGCPKEVQFMDCRSNQLTSLEGLGKVSGMLYLDYTTSLPLLRLVTISGEVGLSYKNIFGSGQVSAAIQLDVLIRHYQNRTDMPLKNAIFQCSNKMIEHGHEENAKW